MYLATEEELLNLQWFSGDARFDSSMAVHLKEARQSILKKFVSNEFAELTLDKISGCLKHLVVNQSTDECVRKFNELKENCKDSFLVSETQLISIETIAWYYEYDEDYGPELTAAKMEARSRPLTTGSIVFSRAQAAIILKESFSEIEKSLAEKLLASFFGDEQ